LSWRMCRSLERSIGAIAMRPGQDLAIMPTTKYPEIAHESAGII